MAEKPTELSKRLAVEHKRDGRCCYDKEAKREPIEFCLNEWAVSQQQTGQDSPESAVIFSGVRKVHSPAASACS
jgi:hypothetical protein